jgi:hypothetical protein
VILAGHRQHHGVIRAPWLSSAPVVAKPSPWGEASAIGALSGPEPGAREVPWWETGERRREMAQFSDRMVPEVVQVFCAAMARGEFITTAAAEVGTYQGHSVVACGGWCAPAPWSQSEGSLLDVLRAGGDRARARRWRVDAVHRHAAGTQPVDDLQGAASERCA